MITAPAESLHPNRSLENTVVDPVRVQLWHKPIANSGTSSKVQFWITWISRGGEVPPIFIAYHESRGMPWMPTGKHWWVHDGTHRITACRIAGVQCWAQILRSCPPWGDMTRWDFTGQYMMVE